MRILKPVNTGFVLSFLARHWLVKTGSKGNRTDAKTAKNSAASNRSGQSTRESPKLSPTVRKIGRSLNDIVRNGDTSTLVPQPDQLQDDGRRNSWGTSGIPKLRQKLSSNPLLASLAAPRRYVRRTASNRVQPVTPPASGAYTARGKLLLRLHISVDNTASILEAPFDKGVRANLQP